MRRMQPAFYPLDCPAVDAEDLSETDLGKKVLLAKVFPLACSGCPFRQRHDVSVYHGSDEKISSSSISNQSSIAATCNYLWDTVRALVWTCLSSIRAHKHRTSKLSV